jgi:hypothetical protein
MCLISSISCSPTAWITSGSRGCGLSTAHGCTPMFKTSEIIAAVCSVLRPMTDSVAEGVKSGQRWQDPGAGRINHDNAVSGPGASQLKLSGEAREKEAS